MRALWLPLKSPCHRQSCFPLPLPSLSRHLHQYRHYSQSPQPSLSYPSPSPPSSPLPVITRHKNDNQDIDLALSNRNLKGLFSATLQHYSSNALILPSLRPLHRRNAEFIVSSYHSCRPFLVDALHLCNSIDLKLLVLVVVSLTRTPLLGQSTTSPFLYCTIVCDEVMKGLGELGLPATLEVVKLLVRPFAHLRGNGVREFGLLMKLLLEAKEVGLRMDRRVYGLLVEAGMRGVGGVEVGFVKGVLEEFVKDGLGTVGDLMRKMVDDALNEKQGEKLEEWLNEILVIAARFKVQVVDHIYNCMGSRNISINQHSLPVLLEYYFHYQSYNHVISLYQLAKQMQLPLSPASINFYYQSLLQSSTSPQPNLLPDSIDLSSLTKETWKLLLTSTETDPSTFNAIFDKYIEMTPDVDELFDIGVKFFERTGNVTRRDQLLKTIEERSLNQLTSL